jgi:hypothetical protein
MWVFVTGIALLPAAGPWWRAHAGPAINQFEVKDLESSPGDFEFQSQNAWSTGQPRRKWVETGPGEILADDNSVMRQREALEVQLGITDWLRVRVGVEFEQERLDDPETIAQLDSFDSLKLDEVAIEGVVVFIKPKKEGVGLGLLLEYGAPVDAADDPAEFYIGPIIEAHTGPWSIIANLIFVSHIGGKSLDPEFVPDEKWDFSYFTQFQYEMSSEWALALEAYGTFDRLGDSGSPGEEREVFGDHDQHRAGPIVYYTFYPSQPPALTVQAPANAAEAAEGEDDIKRLSVSVGAGVLIGLNENTPDATYKLSLEVDY